MFDWPLDWFSLLIAVGTFVLALKAFNRTDSLARDWMRWSGRRRQPRQDRQRRRRRRP